MTPDPATRADELRRHIGDHNQRYDVFDDPGYQEIEGTDLAAVAAGYVAVTPLHLDLTYEAGLQDLSEHDFQRLLAPAAREVE